MAASRGLKTQSALARKAGVAQSTVGRLLRGEVDPQSETAQRLAEALKIPISVLFAKPTEGDLAGAAEATLEPEQPQGVPLISFVEAGAFAESVAIHPPADIKEWMPCPRSCGPRSFAMRVEVASMEPDYSPGDLIYVDPDVDAAHGRDVLVRVDDRHEITFKQLLIEGGRMYVRSRNPDWPNKVSELPANARIVGVVIGKWVDR